MCCARSRAQGWKERREEEGGCVQLWSLRHLSKPRKHHLTFITLKICTFTRVLLLIFDSKCCFEESIRAFGCNAALRAFRPKNAHTQIHRLGKRKKTKKHSLSNCINAIFKKRCPLCELTFQLKHSDNMRMR